MKRLTGMTRAEILAYNLRGNGHEFTIFADSQPDRVGKARELVRAHLTPGDHDTDIVELGCSAGDISGPFAVDHKVVGVDPVIGAITAAQERYPEMTLLWSPAEELEPIPCDVLVLCEFLEHIVDPIGLVERWAPYAGSMVIGHPLYEDPQVEPGHVWSYDTSDFNNWFRIAGMVQTEAYIFSMGPFPQMIIGAGKR